MTSPATWTTAYAAALADPADTLAFMPQPRGFRDQTVRQAVRLRRGGTLLRLVLSNEFGHAPLVIDRVTVSGAHGKPVRTATLRGSSRWEIPPGEVAASDPVPLSATAGDEITVSCYVAGTAGPGAFLHSAQRTGHVEPGNQAGLEQSAGPGGSQSFSSLYWITRVLTDAAAEGPVIVAFGDSITRGDATTTDGEQRYPDHLQARLLASGIDGAVVLNAGLGGNRLLRSQVGPPMTERFGRDVLSVPEATHVIIMGGLNDLGLPAIVGGPRPTAGEIIDALFGLAHRASRQGIQPVLATLTPILASRYDSFRADGNEDIRQAVNHAIRTQREWPTADFATALADRDDPSRIAAAYDSGDGVHPSDAGARALANAIDLATLAQDRLNHQVSSQERTGLEPTLLACGGHGRPYQMMHIGNS
jgi:lysophospholipase L1-like esterase